VRTAKRDSHSSLGATVPNAAWRLVWALATLKDPEERIRIPGFYDDAKPPTQQEDAFLRALPAEEEKLRENLELRDFVCGVRGYDYQYRIAFEPTCTINGIESGYTGPGMKTVLPAEASAKLDFRLVPDQDPHDIADKLRAHLRNEGFDDVDVHAAEGEFPARSDATHPFVELVRSTAQAVYGKEPVTSPNGPGTQPLYPMMKHLGVPMASAGIGYPDGRAHAPDENIRLADFILGTKHVAAIIEGLGEG
jgi:acetylornithine deacetylase/succinyl-diaminopimelate desuccinylase-like protein